MTAEQEVQHLADCWRAWVGRLPRAAERDMHRLNRRHGATKVDDAISTVASARLRRTTDRLRLFYAYFGEAVPTTAGRQ